MRILRLGRPRMSLRSIRATLAAQSGLSVQSLTC
jgi:hypothetical protein